MKVLMIVTTLTLLLGLANGQVVAFSQDIAGKIFSENQLYLIYVPSQNHDPTVVEIFHTYCRGSRLCTELNPHNAQDYHVMSFIGHTAPQYFAIIDAREKKKYVLEVTPQLVVDLNQFEEGFMNGELDPFYASEDVPDDQPHDCQHLVGRTFEQFLFQEEPVKVVFLQTRAEFCDACPHILHRFIELAEQYHEEGVIRFGHIDLMLNDSPYISDEIMPYFLIFVDENYDEPYGVDAENIDEIEDYVKRLVEDVKKSQRGESLDEEL